MGFKFKTKPYAHQLKALELSWMKDEFALLMDMGTGKSKVLIDTIAALYDAGRIDSAVIMAPKGVYKNWVGKEIPAHMPEHIECTSDMVSKSRPSYPCCKYRGVVRRQSRRSCK